VSGTQRVSLKGFAKTNAPDAPYCVVNEYVAGRLGAALGFPLPPGAIIEHPDGRRAWMTLSFSDVRLPPVDPPDLVRDRPDIAAQCVVFDVLIGNYDRHTGNLAHQEGDHRVEVFDHSHCLLGSRTGLALDWLDTTRGHLVIDGELGGNKHCLMDYVVAANELLAVADEIGAVLTDRVLERMCDDAVLLRMGMDAALGKQLFIWLRTRRDTMTDLLRTNAGRFRGIAPDAWGIV
jgi:hypothetical protein